MKIAITGSTGLIGSAVCRRLSQVAHVLSLGRSELCDQCVDVSDPASVRRLDLKGCDVLVHCAGVVDEDFSDVARAFRQATEGIAALVETAKSMGVSRFVYISSAHVYGPFHGKIDERNPPNPLHNYAIAHFASEQILRRATSAEFCGLAIRPCAVFGIPPNLARFRRWTLIPFDFPRSAVESGTIVLASHGQQLRNFVGTDDIADVIVKWLPGSNAAPSGLVTLNPIGKATISVLDFAELCAQIGEKVTGRPCSVTRPIGQVVQPSTFEYGSIHDWSQGQADLADTVEILMRGIYESSIYSQPAGSK